MLPAYLCVSLLFFILFNFYRQITHPQKYSTVWRYNIATTIVVNKNVSKQGDQYDADDDPWNASKIIFVHSDVYTIASSIGTFCVAVVVVWSSIWTTYYYYYYYILYRCVCVYVVLYLYYWKKNEEDDDENTFFSCWNIKKAEEKKGRGIRQAGRHVCMHAFIQIVYRRTKNIRPKRHVEYARKHWIFFFILLLFFLNRDFKRNKYVYMMHFVALSFSVAQSSKKWGLIYHYIFIYVYTFFLSFIILFSTHNNNKLYKRREEERRREKIFKSKKKQIKRLICSRWIHFNLIINHFMSRRCGDLF